jgi:hypothetical protein
VHCTSSQLQVVAVFNTSRPGEVFHNFKYMSIQLNIKIKNYLWPLIALDIVSGVFAIVLLKILACVLMYTGYCFIC